MDNLPLKDLIVTQNDLRNIKQLASMVQFVKDGGEWKKEKLAGFTKNPTLIYISHFPDDVLCIHDGHHRAVATYLGGRDHFRPDEYEIFKWSYHEYTTFSYFRKWVTPFDPRTEVRLADFKSYKDKMALLYLAGSTSVKTLSQLWRDEYCTERTFHSVEELASQICKKYNFVIP